MALEKATQKEIKEYTDKIVTAMYLGSDRKAKITKVRTRKNIDRELLFHVNDLQGNFISILSESEIK